MDKCKGCKHWEPLFSGKAWGVYSFLDLPENVKSYVQSKLLEQFERDGYFDPDSLYACQVDDFEASKLYMSLFKKNSHVYTDVGVLKTPDWLLWGKCLLTENTNENEPISEKIKLALVTDRSNLPSHLKCHAEFGCVSWEKR